jgi:hypothetical protein
MGLQHASTAAQLAQKLQRPDLMHAASVSAWNLYRAHLLQSPCAWSARMSKNLQHVFEAAHQLGLADGLLLDQLTFACSNCLLSCCSEGDGLQRALLPVQKALKSRRDPSTSQLWPLLVQFVCQKPLDLSLISTLLGLCGRECQSEVWRNVLHTEIEPSRQLIALQAVQSVNTDKQCRALIHALDLFEWRVNQSGKTSNTADPDSPMTAATVMSLLSSAENINPARASTWNLQLENLPVGCRDALLLVKACLLQYVTAASQQIAVPHLVQAHQYAVAALQGAVTSASFDSTHCTGDEDKPHSKPSWPTGGEEWLQFSLSEGDVSAMTQPYSALQVALQPGLPPVEILSWLQLLVQELKLGGNLAGCIPLLWLQVVMLKLAVPCVDMSMVVMRQLSSITSLLDKFEVQENRTMPDTSSTAKGAL